MDDHRASNGEWRPFFYDGYCHECLHHHEPSEPCCLPCVKANAYKKGAEAMRAEILKAVKGKSR